MKYKSKFEDNKPIKKNDDGTIDIPFNTELNLIKGRKKDGSEYKVFTFEIRHGEEGDGIVTYTSKEGVSYKKNELIEKILLDEQFLVWNEDGPSSYQLLDTNGKDLSCNGIDWY